jgi:hypothetical protein
VAIVRSLVHDDDGEIQPTFQKTTEVEKSESIDFGAAAAAISQKAPMSAFFSLEIQEIPRKVGA